MALPTSVKKQADAADAFLSKNGNTTDPAPVVTEKAPVPAEIPAPASVDDSAPQPLDKPLGEPGDPWEARYKILQGKYNKEVPDLHRQLRDVREQNKGAASPGEVERLQAEIASLKKTAAAQPEKITSSNLDQLRLDYSPQLVDGILEAVQNMVAPVQQRVQQVGDSVASMSTESKISRITQLLAAQNLDFGQMNSDPLFVDDYLNQVDPNSGITRHTLLTKAFNEGALDRAARFFTDYASGHQRTSANASDLNRHVQVQTTANAGGEPTGNSRIWTDDSIAQFYRDKQRGKFTTQEATALENQLFAFMGGG